jgi:hypothetical protein
MFVHDHVLHVGVVPLVKQETNKILDILAYLMSSLFCT